MLPSSFIGTHAAMDPIKQEVMTIWVMVQFYQNQLQQLSDLAQERTFELEKVLKKSYEFKHNLIQNGHIDDVERMQDLTVDILAMLHKLKRKCEKSKEALDDKWTQLENMRKTDVYDIPEEQD